MADRSRPAADVSSSAGALRDHVVGACDASRRALRGDLGVLDRYFAVVLPAVFAAFYVFDKGPHRNLFYLFALLPMLLYVRRGVLAAVAQTWTWRLGVALCGLWIVSLAWSATMTLESAFDAVREAGALALFLTACTMIALRERLPVARITWAVVLTAGVCALVTFALAVLPGSGYSAAGRLTGFGWADHAGNGADIYGFAAVVAMVLAVEAGSWRCAVAVWPALAACVVYVLLTESRAPALGLVMAACVFGAVKSPRVAVGILGTAALAGAGVYAAGLVDFADWVARGAAYRLDIWADALQRIVDHPGLGAGGADTGVFHAAGKSFNSPHNGLIGMFYYVGFLGGGIFVALSAYALWHAARHALKGGSGLALAVLVFGLTVLLFHTKTVIVMLNRDWLIYWLPVLIVTAAQARATVGARKTAA
jgi:hypothetical protein